MIVAAGVAAAYVPASMSLADLQQKIDAAKGTLAPGRYRIVTRVTSPEGPHVVVTRFSGDDYLTQSGTGPFDTSWGSFQGHPWYQDEHGMIVFERPDSADTGDTGEGAPVLLGMTDTQPAEYVLRRQAGVDTVLDYYNAATFLLDKHEVRQRNGVDKVTAYADYHDVFGEKRAFTTSYSDGNSANARVRTIVHFERDDAQSSLEPPQPRMLYSLKPGENITLKAEFTDSGIIVPVRLQDQTLDFLLDTGSSALNIDAGALSRLGLHSQLAYRQRVAGDIDVGHSLVPSMSVGPLHMENVAFDVIPDRSQRVVGLLGCDLLVPAIAALDFHSKTVTLLSPDTFDAKALGAVPVRADYDGCVPHITASFNGHTGRFVLDTGADITVLNPPFAASISGKQLLSALYEPEMGGIGGSVDSRFYHVPDVVVGPVEFRVASVAVPSEDGWLMEPGEDGIIGRDVLSAFTLYFDYANNVVYFKPNS